MNKVSSAIKHLINGSFIDALKRQPLKYKRKRWEKILASGKSYVLFRHKSLFKIMLPLDSELSQYIYQEVFEKDEIKFIEIFLRKGDVFIDIGANIGFHSLLASKKVGIHGKVYAFEPTSRTYERFLLNLNINKAKNIIPIKKAISDKRGIFDLNTSQDGFDAWNSFAKPVCGSEYKIEKVDTITLNDFFDDSAIFDTISLIKIDVEGWEKFVLQGGDRFLGRIDSPTILIEFVDDHTRNVGYTCSSLYKILTDYGYNIYSFRKGEIVKETVREFYKGENLIATKNLNSVLSRLK